MAALANLFGGLLLASSGAHRRQTRLLKYLIALGAGFHAGGNLYRDAPGVSQLVDLNW